MGLFYGPGGRERATKEYGELLDPITSLMRYFKWAPGLSGAKDVRRALQAISPKEVSPESVARFQGALAYGPFEQRGKHVLSRHAAGYELPERSSIFHWAATRGLLPELHGRMGPKEMEKMQARLSYLNQSLRTIQEQTGAALPGAISQLEQMGVLGSVPLSSIPRMLRFNQVRKYLHGR